MYYACIENNTLLSILNYVPNVPRGISIIKVTDEDHMKIENQTHIFDVSAKGIVPISTEITNQKLKDQTNAPDREFLNSTDWKVLRHIRQKFLDIPTTLTDVEYIDLEKQRQSAAIRQTN